MFSGFNTVYWGYLLALCSIAISSDAVYLVVFVTALAHGLRSIIRSSTYLMKNRRKDSIHTLPGNGIIERMTTAYLANCWWIIILTWVYGVFVGLLLDVPREYVFRNFFGMVVYITLPLFVRARIPIGKVINLISLAGMFLILILATFLDYSVEVLFSGTDFGSLSELRVTYSAGAFILLPMLSVSAASIFCRKWHERVACPSIVLDYLCTKTGFIILMLVIIIPSMSKGLFLTCVVLILLALIPATIARLLRGAIPVYLFVIVGGLVCFFIFIPSSFLDVFTFTFSNEELSNSMRSEEARFLIDEFSFFGSGLGSSLKSGFVRDDTGYGFELTYHNLIHKLGIFSIPLFVSYMATVLLALYRIFRGYQLLYSYFGLGLMGFLIQGSANPILLSPIAVMLHCFAIYILIYRIRVTQTESELPRKAALVRQTEE